MKLIYTILHLHVRVFQRSNMSIGLEIISCQMCLQIAPGRQAIFHGGVWAGAFLSFLPQLVVKINCFLCRAVVMCCWQNYVSDAKLSMAS